VERPFDIGYEELLDLAAVERPHTLECISNEIGGDLISTAIWVGVPMKELLAQAVPKAGAFDVAMTSVDGYTDSVPLAKALDPDTLIAYLMNGSTLTEEHGFPARALIPGIYGMKNVKWLTKIDVVTGAVEVVNSPTRGAGARRVWSDSKNRLWVSLWNSGEVGLYDPQAKSWKKWKLPGNAPMAYSVYVDDQDAVWLTDFGSNTIVRFDPQREKFQSFPGRNIRQMLGRKGEVWAPESGDDRIIGIRFGA